MNVIEIDAASNNGVDNIRQIREEVQYSPTEGKYKVYIIDEVHMLTTGAFNALLKTLEEPPSYVIFILATTESHKIPITISSRCQKYEFRRISVETISARLTDLLGREHISAEKKAVDYISKVADGSMRDALSILDQCIAFNLGKELTYDNVLDTIGAVDIDTFAKLMEKIIELDVSGAIDVVDEIVWQGRELSRFVSEFTWFMRNVLLMKVSPEADRKLDMSAENMEKVKQLADRIELNSLIRYINIFSETSANIKYAVQKRVVLELAVIKLCKPEMETDYNSILDRLRVVENKLEEGGPSAQNNSNISQDMLQELYDRINSNSAEQTVTGASQEEQSKSFIGELRREMPEADFQELKDIVEQWDVILESYQKITRSFLENAKLNINENKNGLYLTYVRNDENKKAIAYFSDKERMATLCEKISDITERKVNIALRVISNDTKAVQQAEENNLAKINFNIINI
jgi:DNA polymerase-3 subunit gamma/tau